LIDASQIDTADPLAGWKTVNQELALFDPELADKPQIVVASKIDLPEAKEHSKVLAKKLPKKYQPLYSISAATTEGVQALVRSIGRRLDEMKQDSEGLRDAAGT
jgi:GTP-binding protein